MSWVQLPLIIWLNSENNKPSPEFTMGIHDGTIFFFLLYYVISKRNDKLSQRLINNDDKLCEFSPTKSS